MLRITVVQNHLFFLRNPQVLVKADTSDFSINYEVVLDDENRQGNWREYRIFHDHTLGRLVIKMGARWFYVNP
jgi:hypothetical protein